MKPICFSWKTDSANKAHTLHILTYRFTLFSSIQLSKSTHFLQVAFLICYNNKVEVLGFRKLAIKCDHTASICICLSFQQARYKNLTNSAAIKMLRWVHIPFQNCTGVDARSDARKDLRQQSGSCCSIGEPKIETNRPATVWKQRTLSCLISAKLLPTFWTFWSYSDRRAWGAHLWQVLLCIQRYTRFDRPPQHLLISDHRLLPHWPETTPPSIVDGGPGAVARSSVPAIAPIIVLALIVTAVGGGGFILTLRWQWRIDISADSPSFGEDDYVAALTVSVIRWRDRGRSRCSHPRCPKIPWKPRTGSTCSRVRACPALPSLRMLCLPLSSAAKLPVVPEGSSTPRLPYEPSPPSQPCRRCGGCAASRLLNLFLSAYGVWQAGLLTSESITLTLLWFNCSYHFSSLHWQLTGSLKTLSLQPYNGASNRLQQLACAGRRPAAE